MAANRRRIEVIETVEEILDDLLTSVLQTTDELEGISTSQDDVVTTGSTQEMHIEEEGQAKESESKVMKKRVQSIEIKVSDAEREADNNTRVQILLNLLELACCMVNVCYLYYTNIHICTCTCSCTKQIFGFSISLVVGLSCM